VNGGGSSWQSAQGTPGGTDPASGIAQNAQLFPIHGRSVVQSPHTLRSSAPAMVPQKTQRRGISAISIEVTRRCISVVTIAE
jgi:hypothetical protein